MWARWEDKISDYFSYYLIMWESIAMAYIQTNKKILIIHIYNHKLPIITINCNVILIIYVWTFLGNQALSKSTMCLRLTFSKHKASSQRYQSSNKWITLDILNYNCYHRIKQIQAGDLREEKWHRPLTRSNSRVCAVERRYCSSKHFKNKFLWRCYVNYNY